MSHLLHNFKDEAEKDAAAGRDEWGRGKPLAPRPLLYLALRFLCCLCQVKR